MQTTVKELKNGATLDQPIYIQKPYVILSKENVVLHAGTLESIINITDYYDKCIVDIRRYDLFMNDNTKREKGLPTASEVLT